jgi:hypothetical protein
VLAGMFFLYKRPIIILCDSGASHNFLSSTCAKKAKLSLVASGALYVISTPGGRVDADRIVQKVRLKLSGRIFSTNLIILSGQDIYVILGMSWMKIHRAVLDIAYRFVHLDSPVYGNAILHIHTISRIKASLYHVVELKLEDIHIIREFSDVFPDDLPKIPPERAIKVLDQKDRVTRRKTIKFYKIQWSNHTEEEATWESEDFLRSRHLDFVLP